VIFHRENDRNENGSNVPKPVCTLAITKFRQSNAGFDRMLGTHPFPGIAVARDRSAEWGLIRTNAHQLDQQRREFPEPRSASLQLNQRFSSRQGQPNGIQCKA
jgi:hypothetical protein